MGILDAVAEHVATHRSGMLFDLAFAVGWVTFVTVVFQLLDGPAWAYYLFMFAGVVAYFGFVWSLEIARQEHESR